jgi:hypothetical protein
MLKNGLGFEDNSRFRIIVDKHLEVDPQELYDSRAEYQQFALVTFCGHLYQEVKRWEKTGPLWKEMEALNPCKGSELRIIRDD